MTFEALRCFCAVVDTGSFRLAAERLHRSQPAVSQQIKSLEREFGQVLVDRRGGLPTPAGSVVYARGQALLEGAEGLRRELGEFDETSGGELRVGTSDTNALYFLPPHVRAFSKAHPRTRLVVMSRSSDEIASAVEKGGLDLGIVTLPLSRNSLAHRELYRQRMVLVVPKRHPFSKRRRIGLSDLSGEPLVLLEAETRTGARLREYFRRKAFEPEIVLDSGSFEVIKRYVREGVGLSFLPRMVVEASDRRSLSVLEVAGLPAISIGAVWRRGAYQTKAAAAFLDLLAGTGAEVTRASGP